MNNISLPVKVFTQKNPAFLVIAHRGASAYYPENTMSAFKAAYEMGADMIELDISLTKDGEIVVIHDEKLQRTTNGRGRVCDFTLQELKGLDAGFWFNSSFSGETIPTLEEVLKFAENRISLNIEIKTESVSNQLHGGIEEKALQLVEKYEMQDYVLFSSFDYRALKHLRQLDVEISLALLHERQQASKNLPSQLLEKFNAQVFNCDFKKLKKSWLNDASEHKIPVLVYTVNRKKDMYKMKDLGVSGIFTDKPDVLKQLVDNLWETK